MADSLTPAAYSELVRRRHSARAYLPEPLPAEDICAALEDAQRAPSSSNTQPWHVHILSGAARDALSEKLLAAESREPVSDFVVDYGTGVHLQRSQENGAVLYGSAGIAREDQAGRMEIFRENLRFYGAPHVALLFSPLLGDGVRAAGDVGMWAQSFLLSLTARGYRGTPQGIVARYTDIVREAVEVPEGYKFLYAIAFGRGDESSPLYNANMPRVPLAESMTVHDTPGVLD